MRSIFVSSRQTETAQHVHLCVTLVQIWLWNVASLTPTAGMNVRNVAYFKNQMLFSLLAWHTVTVRPLHLLIIIVFVGPVLTSDSFNVQVYSHKSFIMEVRELDSSKQLCALKTRALWCLRLALRWISSVPASFSANTLTLFFPRPPLISVDSPSESRSGSGRMKVAI